MTAFPWSEALAIALIGSSSVVSGHLTTALTARRSTLYSLLLQRVEKLDERVSVLENERDKAIADAREAQRMLWHVLEYLRAVLSWGRTMRAAVPDELLEGLPVEPEPPSHISERI